MRIEHADHPTSHLTHRDRERTEQRSVEHHAQGASFLQLDERLRARIRIEQEEDGDLELRLKLKLKVRFRSFEAAEDRHGPRQTVMRFSESVRVRLRLESSQADGLPDLRAALDQLGERFSALLAGGADEFENAEPADPERLLSDVRDAFRALVSGLFDVFSGVAAPQLAEPEEPAGEPEAEPGGPIETPDATAPPTTTDPQPSDAEPASRFYALRGDLQLRFAVHLRELLAGLTTPQPDDPDEAAGPEARFSLRIDLRQEIQFQLIDTRA